MASTFLAGLTAEQQQMLYDQGASVGPAHPLLLQPPDADDVLAPRCIPSSAAGFLLVRDLPQGSLAGIDGR